MSQPSVRLRRQPAAHAPAGDQPICPHCWSRLDVDWGKGRAVNERPMRGWGVSRTEPPDGDVGALMTAVHRCANRDCPTAVEVTMRLGGGYVPTLVAERTLAGADAARFAAGRHGRDGVWRDARGEPRTAPPQRDLFGG